jgi:hypothetical protein
MKTANSNRGSEGDLAKALENNELQQDETTPEKKKVEKLKLTADDLQQYGKLDRLGGDIERYGLLSWLFPDLQLYVPYSYSFLRIFAYE